MSLTESGTSAAPVRITPEQALAFRSRRHHLLGPGADSPWAVAAAVVGIQAQVVAPALWSLAIRTRDRPTADELDGLVAASSDLVRTWGLRGTVHIYEVGVHWPAITTAVANWSIGSRPGRQPDGTAIDAAERRIESLDRPVTRSDLFDLVPEDYVEWMAERVGPGTPALRGAAGRLVWHLARRGVLCAHTLVDGEQSYVLRRRRYPDLDWTPPPPERAAELVVRAYLAANAPATVQDIAHFLGARVSQARAVVERIEDELVPVDDGARTGLLALAADADDLSSAMPDRWPPRLLPKFDTLLMAHKDKSWTVPEEAERSRIWAKAAQVNATVLDRGRLVATWKHRALKRSVKIGISPLSGWTRGLEQELTDDAQSFAEHLGAPTADVRVV